MQLLDIAWDYSNKIKVMIEQDMATGDASGLRNKINSLLQIIRNQQSEELKDIE